MFRLVAASAALTIFLAGVAAADERPRVDLALVIAADASGSMTRNLRQMQRQGFAAAFRSPHLHAAAMSGRQRRIAVAYVEWAEFDEQRLVIPWRIIASDAAMERFARSLDESRSGRFGPNTSISGALAYSAALLAEAPFDADRQVIDVSGNGVSNDGPPVADMLALLEWQGITVNGLVLPSAPPRSTPDYGLLLTVEEEDVEGYFRRKVRFGPGAFVEVVNGPEDMAPAILRKLVLEVAGTLRPGPG